MEYDCRLQTSFKRDEQWRKFKTQKLHFGVYTFFLSEAKRKLRRRESKADLFGNYYYYYWEANKSQNMVIEFESFLRRHVGEDLLSGERDILSGDEHETGPKGS